jgi:hypothetical protein
MPFFVTLAVFSTPPTCWLSTARVSSRPVCLPTNPPADASKCCSCGARIYLPGNVLVGGKGLAAGKTITIVNGPSAEIVEVLEGSHRRMRFAEPIEPYFPRVGHVPLPPYIHAPLQDPERYQTVYAREPGSAAAPTAGLHFTTRLMDELKSQG